MAEDYHSSKTLASEGGVVSARLLYARGNPLFDDVRDAVVAAAASDSRALKRRLGMKRVLKDAWRAGIAPRP